MEKVLRKDEHLKQNIENTVQINLFKSINLKNEEKARNKKTSKELIGKLKSFDENNIDLKLENGEIMHIDRKNISQIKTVFDWDSLN